MPSALIRSRPGYPAVPRAGQPAHQRSVLPNPLVLGETLRKFPPPTADRDRPVSRRSEPSSRTAFIGEQPNPLDLLSPQEGLNPCRAPFSWGNSDPVGPFPSPRWRGAALGGPTPPAAMDARGRSA